MAAVRLRYSAGKRKSYDIIFILFGRLGLLSRGKRVLDLTYGRGRFYRRVKRYGTCIVGVDIERHEWEVEPCEFIHMDAREYVDRILRGEASIGRVDAVVVDPPWSSEKRGQMPRRTGISGMPYHMPVKSRVIVDAAARLAGILGVPLVYRYKEELPGSSIVVESIVNIMRRQGTVYYGVVMPGGAKA